MFEGTLRIMGHKEVLQIQGMPEPNPVPPGTDFSHERYVVVLLDQKQGVLGILGDGSGETDTIETDILDLYSYTGIGNEEDRSSQWQKYNGKRVVVAADTDDICWPSGVRVPIGAPAFGGDVIFAE